METRVITRADLPSPYDDPEVLDFLANDEEWQALGPGDLIVVIDGGCVELDGRDIDALRRGDPLTLARPDHPADGRRSAMSFRVMK